MLTSWRDVVTAQEPWRDFPVDDQYGELRSVVISLVRYVRAPRSKATEEALRVASAIHGRYRFLQGCDETIARTDVEFLAPAAILLLAPGFRARENLAPTRDAVDQSIRVALEGVARGYNDRGEAARP